MVSYQFVRFYIKAREGCVHAKEVTPLLQRNLCKVFEVEDQPLLCERAELRSEEDKTDRTYISNTPKTNSR